MGRRRPTWQGCRCLTTQLLAEAQAGSRMLVVLPAKSSCPFLCFMHLCAPRLLQW